MGSLNGSGKKQGSLDKVKQGYTLLQNVSRVERDVPKMHHTFLLNFTLIRKT